MGSVGKIEQLQGRESKWHPLSELVPTGKGPLVPPMVTKKPKGLGLGLEALLGPKVSEAPATELPSVLKHEQLQAGKYQPRTRMDEGSLYELAESIKAQGIMQPILVRPISANGSATYEIIRQRLQTHGAALRERMTRLDARRQEVFGAIESKLLQSDRITTAHNCVPRDMVQLGQGRFLFGFNVVFGLKKEIELADVFAAYQRDATEGSFKETDLDFLADKTFLTDFRRLYHVYARAAFAKFSLIGGHLYFVFQVGAGANDIAVFKWAFNG
eukprot:gene53465-65307_t